MNSQCSRNPSLVRNRTSGSPHTRCAADLMRAADAKSIAAVFLREAPQSFQNLYGRRPYPSRHDEQCISRRPRPMPRHIDPCRDRPCGFADEHRRVRTSRLRSGTARPRFGPPRKLRRSLESRRIPCRKPDPINNDDKRLRSSARALCERGARISPSPIEKTRRAHGHAVRSGPT